MRINYSFDDMRIAYIAGFFDGEGYVSVVHKTGGSICLHVGIDVTDEAPLLFIKEMFGGSVRLKAARSASCRPSYLWLRCGRNAAEMLEKLLPYLMVKKKRALLGIQLIGAPKWHQQEIYDDMKKLNRKGPADNSEN